LFLGVSLSGTRIGGRKKGMTKGGCEGEKVDETSRVVVARSAVVSVKHNANQFQD